MKEWVEWILSLLSAFSLPLSVLYVTLSVLDWAMDFVKKRMRGAHKKEDDE